MAEPSSCHLTEMSLRLRAPLSRSAPQFAARRAALITSLAGWLLAAACASDAGTSGLGGGAGTSHGGSAGAAGQAAGGQAGVSSGGGGAGGASATLAGGAGSAGNAGSPTGAGSGGVAGQTAGGSAGTGGAVVCLGAGKSLHFQDDVGGVSTTATRLTADLGADLPIGNSARTLELWVYMEGKESWKSEHSIIEYGGTGRCQAFGIDGGDNGNNDPAQLDPFTFSSGGPCTGDNNLTPSPIPPRTGWLHLAWVYDPTGTLAYLGQTDANFLFTVNGVPQPIPNKKETGALLTLQTSLVIGAGQKADDNGFTGKIDEFRLWNVARSASQIADSYALILKGDEPGLVAYYHFDEGTGTTVKDASSKHHDATFDSSNGRPVPTWVDSTDLTLTCAP